MAHLLMSGPPGTSPKLVIAMELINLQNRLIYATAAQEPVSTETIRQIHDARKAWKAVSPDRRHTIRRGSGVPERRQTQRREA